jgi:hypothetical protein
MGEQTEPLQTKRPEPTAAGMGGGGGGGGGGQKSGLAGNH